MCLELMVVIRGCATCLSFLSAYFSFISCPPVTCPTDMATPSWNYEDQAAWGKVKGWEVAGSGTRQSPIDIDTSLVRTNKHLKPLVLQVRMSVYR